MRRYVGVDGVRGSSYPHWVSLSPRQATQDRRDSGVSAVVWGWTVCVSPRTPTGCPYPPSSPRRTGGTRVYPPLCGGGWCACLLVPPQGATITQATQAGPEGLGCIRRCVGVDGVRGSSYPHGASLSPKQPRQDRRDSGVSALVWGWMVCVSPRTPTGRHYHPSDPGRTGGTRVYPPLCGGGWCARLLVPPRGVPIPQTAQAGPEGLGCIRPCVGVDGVRVSSYPHRAPLSPKRPRQDRRDSGVSAVVWGWMVCAAPRTPTGRPYPPNSPRRTGGTRVYPPLCGGGWCACLLVPPQGATITQATQAGPEGLGCIRRCVGVDGVRVSSYPHGVSLSPKQPRQDRRDSGVSALVWGWMVCVSPRTPTGRHYHPSDPGRTGGTRVYPPLCGGGWCARLLVPPRGVPIPQTAQAGPEGLRCIRRCVGLDGHCAYLVPPRGILIPKRPGRDRWDSGVSIAAGEGRVPTLYHGIASMDVRRERRSTTVRSSRSGGQWSPLCRRPSL